MSFITVQTYELNFFSEEICTEFIIKVSLLDGLWLENVLLQVVNYKRAAMEMKTILISKHIID